MSERSIHRPATGFLTLACTWLLLAGCGEKTPDSSGRSNSGRNLPPAAAGTSGGQASPGGSGGSGFDANNPTIVPQDLPDPKDLPGFDPTCASTNISAHRIVPTVMLVVDGSTSMAMAYGEPEVPDGGVPDGGMLPPVPSRWASIRAALVGPVGVVPTLQGLVDFGLALFGTAPTCPLPFDIIQPARNNAPAIAQGLPFFPPGVYTPTGPALDMVVDRLPDPATVPPDAPPIGPQIIVLATDGDPNSCAQAVTDYAPSIAAALKAQGRRIKMYVVSVGMDAAAQHLQEMANIGQGLPQNANPGADVYYPENPKALSDTLATLIGAELSCELELEGKGVKKDYACMGTVRLDGVPLECNGQNGWELTDETHIKLKGSACETFKSAVDAHLTADFPCEIIIAI